MSLYFKILFPFIILFHSVLDDQDFYKIFMANGFSRLEKCEYQQAYNDFNAAYVLDEISVEQKYKALYYRNISDSCMTFKNYANIYFGAANYKLAAYYFLRVYSLNKSDEECRDKNLICEKRKAKLKR